MPRIIPFTILIFAILGASCKDSEDEKPDAAATTTLSQKTIPADTTQKQKGNTDTLVVQIGCPHIIAIALDQNEYDDLSEQEADEYTEVHSDAMYYLGEFADKVKGTDIEISESASRYLRIGNTVIDTRNPDIVLDHIYVTKTGKFEVVEWMMENEIQKKARSMNPPLIP